MYEAAKATLLLQVAAGKYTRGAVTLTDLHNTTRVRKPCSSRQPLRHRGRHVQCVQEGSLSELLTREEAAH